MSYTLDRIQKEFTAAVESVGIKVSHPISLNGRLSKSLGRVVHLNYDGYIVPEKIEFSKNFIENGTDKDIREVILHEAGHYVVAMRTHQIHNHDDVFKATCIELGTLNYQPHFESMETKLEYKYNIYCPVCKKNIGGYNRMCKTIKLISAHSGQIYCKTCKCRDLEVR